MELQVTEYHLLIMMNALTERLEKVNQSVEKMHERIRKIKEAIEEAKTSKTSYPVSINVLLEKLNLTQYKHDILMDEVYQLENLLHEVSVTQK
jgi:hypothetical protein